MGDWHVPLVAGDDWQRAEVSFTIPKRTARLLVALELAGLCTTNLKDREVFHKDPQPSGAGHFSSSGSSYWLAALPPCEAWVDDVALEELGDDGAYQVVMQKPILSAEHRLAVQWIKLYHGEGRPYLLLGRMLHPPRLDAQDAGYVTTQPIQARVPLHIYGSGSKIIQTAPINISGDTDWAQKTSVSPPESASTAQCIYLADRRTLLVLTFAWRNSTMGELVANGDFEQWHDPEPSRPVGRRPELGRCRTGQYARDEEEKHGGKFAIKLTNRKKDVVHLSQTLPVDGKTLHPERPIGSVCG